MTVGIAGRNLPRPGGGGKAGAKTLLYAPLRSDTPSRRALLILAGLIGLAVVVRVIGLNSGLWYDEIATLLNFVRKPLSYLVTTYSKNNHPLYSLLAQGAVTLFGEHPWSFRLPALLFGLATIPMTFWVGAATGSVREGLLGAALLSVAYHHVWFSQNGRGYTALAFWTLLAGLALVRAVRAPGLRWPIVYGVAAALGVYTHLGMGFVVVGHFAGWLWLVARGDDVAARRAWRHGAIGFVLAGVLSALMYAPMVGRLVAIYRAPIPIVEIGSPRWALRETLSALELGFGAWGAVLGVLLFVVGLSGYWRQKWIAMTLFVLPTAVTILGVVVLKVWLAPRFFFFLIGVGALVVARGALIVGTWLAARGPRVAQRLGATAMAASLVGLVMLVNVLALGHLYRYPKQDYEGAMKYVEARQRPGDAVVTAGLAGRAYREYYGKAWADVMTPDEAQRARAAARQLWIIHTLLQFRDPPLFAWMRRECRVVEIFPGTVAGADVVVCVL